MAHNVEPMDIDNIESDFDNKENSIHHSNVYPRTPCTEKGYEELDVSELNMKLRYSITPASSPMSKSFTANCVDNRSLESGDDNVNSNLTRSLHSAISKDVSNKTVKLLPLQTISTEQFVDSNRNVSILRPLDTTSVIDNNVTITVSGGNDAEESMSLPSLSSSTAQTPEATTPTKDIPRNDGGSPIMRGLKSVLNMFRSSQSPIPPAGSADSTAKQVLSPTDVTGITPDSSIQLVPPVVLASTPIAANRQKESSLSKRSSPLKESLVFNEDLEKELLWKDETTILFSQEKIPIHKLFFQQGTSNMQEAAKSTEVDADLNSTVEYMDVSFNDSIIKNRTITEVQAEAMHANESDGEFVDCETTYTNDKVDSSVTDPIDTLSNERNLSSNVTEIVSAINAERNSTNTETAVKVTEDLVVTELQHPDATTSLTTETTNIPQIKCEPETSFSEQESPINITNNVNDIKQDISEVITSVNDKSVSKIIETNVKSESQIPSYAAFDTPTLIAEAATEDVTVKELQPNELQTDITFETIKGTDIELLPSSISIPNLETKMLSENFETNNGTVPNSLVVNTEINATLYKEIENPANVSVKNEDKLNVLNVTQMDLLDLAANIPLPDDDDIENEKSIGTVMLVEEGTVPLSLDIINTTATGLENVHQVENMPTVPAKSMDINNIIDDCLAIKDIVETNNENKSEQVIKVSNDNISVEITQVQEEIKPMEMLPINEPMDTNDSVSDVKVINVGLEQNIVKYIEQSLDITSEQVLDSKDQTIQPDCQTIFKTPTDGIGIGISEINEANAKETEINVMETSKMLDSVDNLVSNNEIEHRSDFKLEDNIAMNNTATSADILKGSQEQFGVDVSQVIPETAVIFDAVQDKSITDNGKSIPLNANVTSEEIEEIPQKHVSLENSFAVKSTASLSEDVCDPYNLKDSQDLKIVIDKGLPEETFLKEKTVINNVVENVENKDEEIILSENNSPYVSLTVQMDQVPEQINFEEIQNSSATKSNELLTPPSSPKIVSKGYNFDFDDIEDPFATKTRIRTSPTPDTPERPLNECNTTVKERPPQRDVNKNRRKSQPERKKPTMPKKKMNSTFCGSLNESKATSNIKPEVNNHIPNAIEHKLNVTADNKYIETKLLQKDIALELEPSAPILIDTITVGNALIQNSPEIMSQELTSKEITKEEKSVDSRDIDTTMEDNAEENKSSEVSLNAISIEAKHTSSSEHSTYYSAGTSSGEGTVSRNVFNLPEIDDMNFNPFVTKSKMRQSPPPNLNTSATLNATQESPISFDTSSKLKSDTTFTEDPFETKSKMRQSPPLEPNASANLNATQEFPVSFDAASTFKSNATFTENPFETKSKMRQSPPLSSNASATINATQEIPCSSDTELQLKSDATFTQDNTEDLEFNKDFETKILSTFDDKEYANISNTTSSSKATDEKDLTVREVHTEDEDTTEGPFLEAEDLNNEDKMSDFDGEDVDMMQFSELPPQSTNENVDGELFIDAEAFEFLLNQNKSNYVADSGKESLFLKFDPLFAKRISLNKKRQSTPKKMSAAVQMDATFDKSIAGPSTLNTTHELPTSRTVVESTDDFNATVSKPMMVVTPAVNPIVTPRTRTATPPSSNRRSITFTSPAIAVIDRLLSLSANNSLVGHDTTVTHMSREQNEADLALTQLRELLAEKEINVYNLRTESKELKDRLSSLESQMRILESEGQDRLKKINDLNEKLSEKTKLNKSMAAVVEEYERTIASLIAETEQDKKRNNEERIRLMKERDEQTAHLASMEVSFSDLHSKYEKSKQIILTCKANEDAYKKSIKEFEENLTKMQSNYELLKQHATSKLNHANQELEKLNRSHESEVLKFNAMIKRKELHITSLEETLAQKTKANEELTAICDELINKVG